MQKSHRPDNGPSLDTPTTTTTTTQANGNGIEEGVPATQHDVYLRMAQDVVDQSNADKDDAFWQAMNGGNEGVEKDGAVKPDAWIRGIMAVEQKDGTRATWAVHDHENGGVGDLEAFRAQISEDLNFNNAFEDFKTCQEFVKALVIKYAGDISTNPERKGQVEGIGENLWSYAKFGTDVNGDTNVAELQGMLYSLDSMIRVASQSNTKHDGTFTIPGTEIELDSLGDGIYGRASILECRMLAALIDEMPPTEEPTPMITVFEEQQEEETTTTSVENYEDYDEFDRSYLIVDNSASMRQDFPMLVDMLEEVDYGETMLGGMTDAWEATTWSEAGFQSSEDVVDTIEDVAKTYKKALRHKSKKGKPSKRRVRGIKDARSKDNAFSRMGAGATESSIHQALTLLKEIAAEPAPAISLKQQIVVATDEDDARPEELAELRDLAREADILVKLLYMNNQGLYEITINDISNDTLALIDADYATRADQNDEAAWDLQQQKAKLLNDWVPDDEKKSSKDEDTRVVRLDWSELAELEGIEPVKSIKDRESRR